MVDGSIDIDDCQNCILTRVDNFCMFTVMEEVTYSLQLTEDEIGILIDLLEEVNQADPLALKTGLIYKTGSYLEYRELHGKLLNVLDI